MPLKISSYDPNESVEKLREKDWRDKRRVANMPITRQHPNVSMTNQTTDMSKIPTNGLCGELLSIAYRVRFSAYYIQHQREVDIAGKSPIQELVDIESELIQLAAMISKQLHT